MIARAEGKSNDRKKNEDKKTQQGSIVSCRAFLPNYFTFFSSRTSWGPTSTATSTQMMHSGSMYAPL